MQPSDPPIKPFLKWVGGKTQIIDKIIERFPSTIANYYEPFLGGGSVLLALLEQKRAGQILVTGDIVACDANPYLIGLYQNVQTNVDELIEELRNLETLYFSIGKSDTVINRSPQNIEDALKTSESFYYWIRSQFNLMQDKTSSKGSAMFLFMNKTCFRGMCREGPNGFNVPYGHYKNPHILDESLLRTVSTLLQGVVFRCCDYLAILPLAGAGDFVYMDPPYAAEKPSSFVGYTADGFDEEESRRLFQQCQDAAKRGAKWLLSNADVPIVRKTFENSPNPAVKFVTEVVVCRRRIHSKRPESVANEVLISWR